MVDPAPVVPAPVTVHPIASSEAGVFLSHEELRRFADAVHRSTIDAVIALLSRPSETAPGQGTAAIAALRSIGAPHP